MRVFYSEYKSDGTWVSTGCFICKEDNHLWKFLSEQLEKLPMVIIHKGDRMTIYSLAPGTEIVFSEGDVKDMWGDE